MLALIAGSAATPAALAATCTISALPVAFGIYDPTSVTPRDSTGSVTVTCTTLVGLFLNWTVMLNQGNGGSFLPRTMTNGSHTLNYNLFTDVNRTQIWGDGTSGTTYISDGLTLLIGSNPASYVVYGRIPNSQDVAALTYSDTITASVNF